MALAMGKLVKPSPRSSHQMAEHGEISDKRRSQNQNFRVGPLPRRLICVEPCYIQPRFQFKGSIAGKSGVGRGQIHGPGMETLYLSVIKP